MGCIQICVHDRALIPGCLLSSMHAVKMSGLVQLQQLTSVSLNPDIFLQEWLLKLGAKPDAGSGPFTPKPPFWERPGCKWVMGTQCILNGACSPCMHCGIHASLLFGLHTPSLRGIYAFSLQGLHAFSLCGIHAYLLCSWDPCILTFVHFCECKIGWAWMGLQNAAQGSVLLPVNAQ